MNGKRLLNAQAFFHIFFMSLDLQAFLVCSKVSRNLGRQEDKNMNFIFHIF